MPDARSAGEHRPATRRPGVGHVGSGPADVVFTGVLAYSARWGSPRPLGVAVRHGKIAAVAPDGADCVAAVAACAGALPEREWTAGGGGRIGSAAGTDAKAGPGRRAVSN